MVNTTKIILKEVNLSNKIIQIEILQKDRINESLTVLHEGFFPYENVCLGAALTSNPVACDELAKLAEIASEDGVSLIAVEKDTDKIVGVSFNKIQTLSKSNEPGFFEKYRDEHCSQENSISLMNFMIDVDSTVDVFEMFKADCAIEIMFLAVLPNSCKKGIGKELVESSLTYAESLQKNNNDNKSFPKIASAILTSIFSYKIFKKLGFEDVIRKEFSDYTFKGKWKYSDKVDCNIHNKGVTLMVKRLINQPSEK